MTKVLILGGLAGQVDALESLRRRGVETHMCGHEKKGPGVDEADHFHIADITSVDAVKRVAIEIGADMVYSVGSDIAMPTVVRVSEDLGLPHFHGVELTDILRQKQENPSATCCARPKPGSIPHRGKGGSLASLERVPRHCETCRFARPTWNHLDPGGGRNR